jgi:galactose mutarotase-like enzyme
MTFRGADKTLVFWTLKDQSFSCLEPWTAPGNALNTGLDLIHLPGGSHLGARMTFGVTLSPG